MSADRLNSKGTVVLKSETFDTNTTSGSVTTRIYTGSKANMVAQRMVEIGFGAAVTKLESTGDGNYQLTAGYTWDTSQGGSSEPPVNAHNLEISMSTVDVWLNPNFRAQFVSIFGGEAAANTAIGYVEKVVKLFNNDDNQNTAQTTAEAKINTDYPGSTAYTALILNAFRGVALKKVTNSLQFDSVYERRITAASFNQVQAGFVGVGKVWTTAEVLAFESVPSAWWFQLPSTYLWLKAAPRVSTVSRGKTEISYSYIAGFQAWGLLYQAYNSATLLNF